MRRILLISYLFPPAASVGGQRAVRIANHLPGSGYDVEVLTTDIGSGEADFDEGLLDLVSPGVTVHRVPARFYFGRNPWRPPPRGRPLRYGLWKLAAYAEWLANPVDPYAVWARDARDEAIRLLGRRPADAVMVSGPPFSPVVEAVEIKRVTGVPLIADFRDLWAIEMAASEDATSWRMRRLTRRVLDLERRLTDAADLVVLTNEDAAECYRSTYRSCPAEKFVVVPNAHGGPGSATAATGSPGILGEEVTLLHTGSLAYGRSTCALNLLRAMSQVQRERTGPRLHALFVGAGEPGTVARLASPAGLDSFTEVPRVSRSKALELQSQADVLVALQASDLGSRLAVPAKLFEYMTAAKPILGVFPNGPAARIIQEHDLGEVGDCDDVPAIRRALERMLGRLEKRQPAPAPPECYSAPATMQSLASFIDSVLQSK